MLQRCGELFSPYDLALEARQVLRMVILPLYGGIEWYGRGGKELFGGHKWLRSNSIAPLLASEWCSMALVGWLGVRNGSGVLKDSLTSSILWYT